VLFVSINIFAVSTAFNEARKVRSGYYENVTMELDSCAVKSDRNIYYIGQTKKYVFVFNSFANSTKVYPIERVKSIEF
jgi:hypothetical protein